MSGKENITALDLSAAYMRKVDASVVNKLKNLIDEAIDAHKEGQSTEEIIKGFGELLTRFDYICDKWEPHGVQTPHGLITISNIMDFKSHNGIRGIKSVREMAEYAQSKGISVFSDVIADRDLQMMAQPVAHVVRRGFAEMVASERCTSPASKSQRTM